MKSSKVWQSCSFQIALKAYQAIIMIELPVPDWDPLGTFVQAVARRAKSFYNYTYSPDEYVRYLISLKGWEVVKLCNRRQKKSCFWDRNSRKIMHETEFGANPWELHLPKKAISAKRLKWEVLLVNNFEMVRTVDHFLPCDRVSLFRTGILNFSWLFTADKRRRIGSVWKCISGVSGMVLVLCEKITAYRNSDARILLGYQWKLAWTALNWRKAVQQQVREPVICPGIPDR